MSPHHPTVSVIIPVYRAEDYLRRCVASVVSQSYCELEIILVEDGSPDHSREICDALASEDSRITVIHQENAGPGAARNTALDACSGEYITFVDADDAIAPEMVADLVTTATAHECDVVICGYQVISPLRTAQHRPTGELTVLNNESLMYEYLCSGSFTGVLWAKLFRSQLFNSIRLPVARAREDEYVMHELLGLACSAVILPHPHYLHTARHGSIERSGFSPEFMIALETRDRLVDYVADRYPAMLPCALFRRAEARASIMRMIRSSCRYRENRELYLSLRDALRGELAYLELAPTVPHHKSVAAAAKDGSLFRLGCILDGARDQARGLLQHDSADWLG